jgi:hypothetical protein
MNNNFLQPPIFILGTQRSGTTLLTRMLSAHNKLFVQNEVNVQKVFLPNFSKENIVNAINQEIHFRFSRNVFDIMSEEHKTHWGIKDPELTYYLPQLSLFLPQSKFVLIIRDPRAVVNSYMENKWGLGTTAYTGAVRWVDEVSKQIAFAKAHPDNVLMIRFEDLISNLEATLRSICQHIGLEFDIEMLTYNKKKALFVENKQNINTNKAPDIHLAEKWRQKLSLQEINYIESVAQTQMLKLSYPTLTDAKSPSSVVKWYFKLHQLFIGEIQLQIKWRTARRRVQKRKKSERIQQYESK